VSSVAVITLLPPLRVRGIMVPATTTTTSSSSTAILHSFPKRKGLYKQPQKVEDEEAIRQSSIPQRKNLSRIMAHAIYHAFPWLP
jgi:hypothetical protein